MASGGRHVLYLHDPRAFIYRGGDVAGAGIHGALSALGTLTLMAAATVRFAAVWCLLSAPLGRVQRRKDSSEQPATAQA